MSDILYISRVIKNKKKINNIDKIILNYNHCRFLNVFSLDKVKEDSVLYEYYDHFKSFKFSFFVSLFYYFINIYLFIAIN